MTSLIVSFLPLAEHAAARRTSAWLRAICLLPWSHPARVEVVAPPRDPLDPPGAPLRASQLLPDGLLNMRVRVLSVELGGNDRDVIVDPLEVWRRLGGSPLRSSLTSLHADELLFRTSSPACIAQAAGFTNLTALSAPTSVLWLSPLWCRAIARSWLALRVLDVGVPLGHVTALCALSLEVMRVTTLCHDPEEEEGEEESGWQALLSMHTLGRIALRQFTLKSDSDMISSPHLRQVATRLTNLRALRLVAVAFSGAHRWSALSVEPLTQLTSLHVELFRALPSGIQALTNLTCLHVDSCYVGDSVTDTLVWERRRLLLGTALPLLAPRLATLGLCRLQLCGELAAFAGALVRVRELDLSGNPRLDVRSLAGCASRELATLALDRDVALAAAADAAGAIGHFPHLRCLLAKDEHGISHRCASLEERLRAPTDKRHPPGGCAPRPLCNKESVL